MRMHSHGLAAEAFSSRRNKDIGEERFGEHLSSVSKIRYILCLYKYSHTLTGTDFCLIFFSAATGLDQNNYAKCFMLGSQSEFNKGGLVLMKISF